MYHWAVATYNSYSADWMDYAVGCSNVRRGGNDNGFKDVTNTATHSGMFSTADGGWRTTGQDGAGSFYRVYYHMSAIDTRTWSNVTNNIRKNTGSLNLFLSCR